MARLFRLLVAYDYYLAEQSKTKAREEAGKLTEEVTQTKAAKRQAAADAKNVLKAMDDVAKRRLGEAGGPLDEAAKLEKADAEALVRASAARDHARETRCVVCVCVPMALTRRHSDGERATLADLEARVKDVRAQLSATLLGAAESSRRDFEQAQGATRAARQAVDDSHGLIASAESGVGADGGLQEQVMKAQAEMQAAETAGKQSQLLLGHLKKELAGVRAELAEAEKQGGAKDVDALKAAVAKLQAEMATLPAPDADADDGDVDAELGPARDTLKEVRSYGSMRGGGADVKMAAARAGEQGARV